EIFFVETSCRRTSVPVEWGYVSGILRTMTRRRQPTDWEKRMGTRLKQLRKAAGLSQAKLAERAGVTPRTVQNWEYGTRTFDFEPALRLADALGITLDELAGRTPPTKRKGKK